MSKEHQGRRTLPEEVQVAEQRYIANRRKEAGIQEHEPDSEKPVEQLFGIALSGGGIRSATFSLGILQELARARVLRLADYLCTVSGGGYLGACLSSLMSKATDLGGKSWRDTNKTFDVEDNFPLHDVDQIHHLRKHGDFLILRKGLIRRDVLRAIGTILIGLLCTMGMFLVFMSGIACLFMACTDWLAGPGLWSNETSSSMWARFRTALEMDSGFLLVFCGGFAVAATLWMYTFHTRTESAARGGSGETSVERGQRFRLKAFFGFIFAGMVASIVFAQFLDPEKTTNPALLLWPLSYSVGAWLAVFLLFIFVAAGSSKRWDNTHRSLFGAMQGICLYCMIASLMIPALVIAIDALQGGSLPSGLAAVISLIAARVFAKHEPAKLGAGAGLWRKALTAAPMAVLALAVVVLVAAVFLFLGSAAIACGITDWKWGLWLAAVAALVVFLGLGTLLDFNRISPHYFYRDRLAETYLRTEARVGDELKIVRDDYHLKIRELHQCADGENASAGGNPAPYHLILCSLNLPGSRDLARKDRRSDHFIFSQEYCGSSTTGYVPTEKYRKGKTKLCAAMTISGAAASSMMGFYTSFGQAFAMTLFNVRLGFWLINPRLYYGTEGYAETARSRTDLEAGMLSHDVRANRCLERFVFWPFYLYREFTASGDAQHQLVNLSDGGHTGDNLGIYPLLQRRCKLIIACDGEADPKYNFGSLTAAMRQIYTDENVIVDFKLMNLKPSESGGRPVSHYLIGKVRYPKCEDANGKPTSEASTGWIICLKSSLLMKKEPATVIGYASKHKDFPHQTTADQFFDDDQFEAYRALGEHIARTMVADSGLAAETEGDSGDAVTTKMLVDWCDAEYAKIDS